MSVPFGFYYANSLEFGIRRFRDVQGFSKVYADFEVGSPWPRLLGKVLWCDLGMYAADEESPEAIRHKIELLRPKWGKVRVLECRDEPPPVSWPAGKLDAIAKRVKAVVKGAGLAPKPVGYNYGPDDILRTDRWNVPSVDYIGFELYLKRKAGETPAMSARRVTPLFNKLVARIPAGKKITMVAMAYDQRKTLISPDRWAAANLVAIQEPTFSCANSLGDRLLTLLAFNYAGRVGGVSDYPALKAEIKRLAGVYA